MEYICEKCHWIGTWDDLILETMCPICRSTTQPLTDEHEKMLMRVRRDMRPLSAQTSMTP